jgi:hypothetical protein
MSSALGAGLLQEPAGILRNTAAGPAEAAAETAAASAAGDARQSGAEPRADAHTPLDPGLLRALQRGIDGPETWSPGLWNGLFVGGMVGGCYMGATVWHYYDDSLAVAAGWMIAACLMTLQVCLAGCRIIRDDLGEQGLSGKLLRGEASAACEAALQKTMFGLRVAQHGLNAGCIVAGLWVFLVLGAGEPSCGGPAGCSVDLGEPICLESHPNVCHQVRKSKHNDDPLLQASFVLMKNDQLPRQARD